MTISVHFVVKSFISLVFLHSYSILPFPWFYSGTPPYRISSSFSWFLDTKNNKYLMQLSTSLYSNKFTYMSLLVWFILLTTVNACCWMNCWCSSLRIYCKYIMMLKYILCLEIYNTMLHDRESLCQRIFKSLYAVFLSVWCVKSINTLKLHVILKDWKQKLGVKSFLVCLPFKQ